VLNSPLSDCNINNLKLTGNSAAQARGGLEFCPKFLRVNGV
jgi:hypothetical protein